MIRRIVSLLGWINVTAWGLVMSYTLITQWYAPNNTVIFHFNTFGEAFIEYIIGLIMFPCTLYHLGVTGKHTWKLLERKLLEIL